MIDPGPKKKRPSLQSLIGEPEARPSLADLVGDTLVAQPAADATAQLTPPRSIRTPPPESGVGIRGQSVLSMIDAFNPLNDEMAGAVMAGKKFLSEGAPMMGPMMPRISPDVANEYTSTRDAARAPVREFAYYNPGIKAVEDIGAGLLTPPIFGPAKAGMGPLRRALTAGAKGAGEAALYGFAGAEGDLGDQAGRTALSGLLGGTFAGGTQALTGLALRDPTGDIMARSAAQQGDVPLETILQGVPAKVDQDMLRPVAPWSPAPPPPPPGSPLPSPRVIAPPPREPAVTGMEAMGRTGQDLAQRVARQGGAPAERLASTAEDVVGGGARRVTQVAEDALQVHGDDPRKVLSSLDEAQQATSGPNYAKAFGTPDAPNTVQVTDRMRTVLEDAAFRDAAEEQRAFMNAALDKATGSTRATPIPPLYDNAGNLVADQIPLELIDKVKQGMDNVAQKKGTAAVPLTRTQSRDVGEKLEQLRSEADLQSPDYATARREHKVFEDQKEALRLGLDAFKPTERVKGQPTVQSPVSLARKVGALETRDAADGLNRAELYRVGVVYRVGQQIKRSGKLTPEAMDRLTAVLPEGSDVQAVANAIRKEGDRANVAKILRRLTEAPQSAGHDAGLASAAGNLGAGNTGRGMANLLTRGIDQLSGKAVPDELALPVRQRLADALSARGPALQEQADALLTRRQRLGRSVDRSTRVGRAGPRVLFDLLGGQ